MNSCIICETEFKNKKASSNQPCLKCAFKGDCYISKLILD